MSDYWTNCEHCGNAEISKGVCGKCIKDVTGSPTPRTDHANRMQEASRDLKIEENKHDDLTEELKRVKEYAELKGQLFRVREINNKKRKLIEQALRDAEGYSLAPD